jgi:hypothetical protein
MDQNDEILFENWFLKRNLSEKSEVIISARIIAIKTSRRTKKFSC